MGIIVDLARMRARARGGILPGPQVLNPASVNARARACVVVAVRASPLKAGEGEEGVLSRPVLILFSLTVLRLAVRVRQCCCDAIVA